MNFLANMELNMDSNHTHHEGQPYNIATVVTFDYLPFFLVFINSLFKNTKHELIKTIYVITDRLPSEFIDYFQSYEKIRLISDEASLNFSGAHGEAWKKAVGKKLISCQIILQKDTLPLVLIDSDTLFIDDISHYITNDFDVLITYIF